MPLQGEERWEKKQRQWGGGDENGDVGIKAKNLISVFIPHISSYPYISLLLRQPRSSVLSPQSGCYNPVMNPWDSAPFLPILEEAGGTFTDWSGSAISTNGLVSPEIEELLA